MRKLMFVVFVALGGLILSSCQSNSSSSNGLSTSIESKDSTAIHVDTSLSFIDTSTLKSKSSIINSSEIHDSSRLLIKAFDDIKFGVKCYTTKRFPGLSDLPYGVYTISGIDFRYESVECSEKYGLYSFWLNQQANFADLEEINKEAKNISKIVSYKYGDFRKVVSPFHKGGHFSKEYKHRVLQTGDDPLNDKEPKDDYDGMYYYQWSLNSITIRLGYYKDYLDIPTQIDKGYSSVTKSTIKEITGYTYKPAYKLSLYFESESIKKIVISDSKKQDDSMSKIDRSKF